MAVVTFDSTAWATRYPEFGSVLATTAQEFFLEATIYCDPTDASPVQDPATRAMLLNMLTAHIAALNGCGAGGQGSGLIGRISTASEGSVSASTSFIDAKSQLEAWANQTKYGAAWWAATSQYRRFVYAPGPRSGYGPRCF